MYTPEAFEGSQDFRYLFRFLGNDSIEWTAEFCFGGGPGISSTTIFGKLQAICDQNQILVIQRDLFGTVVTFWGAKWPPIRGQNGHDLNHLDRSHLLVGVTESHRREGCGFLPGSFDFRWSSRHGIPSVAAPLVGKTPRKNQPQRERVLPRWGKTRVFKTIFFGKDCKNFIEFQGFMKLQEPSSTSRFARARNVLKNVSSCFSEFQAWTMWPKSWVIQGGRLMLSFLWSPGNASPIIWCNMEHYAAEILWRPKIPNTSSRLNNP